MAGQDVSPAKGGWAPLYGKLKKADADDNKSTQSGGEGSVNNYAMSS